MTKAKGRAPARPKAERAPVPLAEVQHSPFVEAPTAADNPDRGLDRVAVLEPTANVPYRVLPATGPTKEQTAAQKKAEVDGKALAKLREDSRDKVLKDRESRSVTVRALRLGFYPADGKLRKPGDVFEYLPVKDAKTGKEEELLPSWMQHVDGKLESRVVGETSSAFDNEPAAVITVGKDGSVTRSSGKVI